MPLIQVLNTTAVSVNIATGDVFVPPASELAKYKFRSVNREKLLVHVKEIGLDVSEQLLSTFLESKTWSIERIRDELNRADICHV